MIYDLNKPLDRDRSATRVQHLMDRSAIGEVTEKAYKNGNQNRYLHALIGAVALEVGETLDYVKRVYYKTTANYSLFMMMKDDKLLGEQVTVLRSSAELTKEEMNASIARFKVWAAKEGIYLPEPEDADRLKEIEYQIAKYEKYLKA